MGNCVVVIVNKEQSHENEKKEKRNGGYDVVNSTFRKKKHCNDGIMKKGHLSRELSFLLWKSIKITSLPFPLPLGFFFTTLSSLVRRSISFMKQRKFLV